MTDTFKTTVEQDNQLDAFSSGLMYCIEHPFQCVNGQTLDADCPFPVAVTGLKISAFLSAPGTDGDYTFQVTKNGVSVGSVLTVRQGEVYGEVALSGVTIDVTDYFGLICVNAPSIAGVQQNIRIRFHYQRTP